MPPYHEVVTRQPSHYEVLGVDQGATDAEVRTAYHRLARRHHPDFHASAPQEEQDRARRRMQEVNAAWAVLSDSERRESYDRTLADAVTGAGSGSGERAASGEARMWGLDDEELAEARFADRERWVPPSGPPRRRPLLVAPVFLVAASLVLAVLWVMIGVTALFALSAMSGVAGVVLFLVAPIVEMAAARRDE